MKIWVGFHTFVDAVDSFTNFLSQTMILSSQERKEIKVFHRIDTKTMINSPLNISGDIYAKISEVYLK